MQGSGLLLSPQGTQKGRHSPHSQRAQCPPKGTDLQTTSCSSRKNEASVAPSCPYVFVHAVPSTCNTFPPLQSPCAFLSSPPHLPLLLLAYSLSPGLPCLSTYLVLICFAFSFSPSPACILSTFTFNFCTRFYTWNFLLFFYSNIND